MAKIFADQEYEIVTRHPMRQQSRTNHCNTRRLPLLLGMFQRCWSILTILSVMLLSSCGSSSDLSGVAKVVEAIAREELSFTVLTINLQERVTDYGGHFITWQDRYGRIADWIDTNRNTPGVGFPDFIALQEVDGTSNAPFGGHVLRYETIFTLLKKLHDKTSIQYRVAYFVVGPTPQGLSTLWNGKALLYNPNRVKNIPHTSNLG